MIEGTVLHDFSLANRIPEKCQGRIIQLIYREVEDAVNQARKAARDEAKGEAVAIIAEARRKADQILSSAKDEAGKIITQARNQAQAAVEQAARRQAIRQQAEADPTPNVVPPPFVNKESDLSQYGRMPVFWA